MSFSREKVLVTGASGFLGREVVKELVTSGNYEVYGLVGKSGTVNSVENLPAANIFKVDISDYETVKILDKPLTNTAVVVHTAGLAHQFGRVTKDEFWSINVRGTENVCKLSAEIGAKRFVLISSVSVYGEHGNVEIDESFECRPEGFYGESKLESEVRATEFCRANDIDLTILRPSTIIGQGDRGNTSRLIELIKKKRFVWIGSGDNKKSLIYKNDVARGILRTIEAERDESPEIYNLTSEAVFMKEIVKVIAVNLNLRTPRLKIPANLVRGFFLLNRTPLSIEYLRKFEKTFEKWLSDDIFSGKKFQQRFNFAPETSISDALGKQVDYYLKYQEKRY